jgi:hypothetical protein
MAKSGGKGPGLLGAVMGIGLTLHMLHEAVDGFE